MDCGQHERWRLEKPERFKVELIPSGYLPVEVYDALGGFLPT